MNYKLNDICSNLGIGKSTVYNRIDVLKKEIPESDWKRNDFFYYDNNKLFFTEKGFEFIKDFKKRNSDNKQNSVNDVSVIYQNQIIDMLNQRIEYLETENKRLMDILSVKEKRELAKDMKVIESSNTISFLDKIKNMLRK